MAGSNCWRENTNLTARQQMLLDQNREIAVKLVEEVDSLVEAAEFSVTPSNPTRPNSRFCRDVHFYLAISFVSVVGAFLITWLFVGKVLLRRIHTLSNRMLRMAGGDLETEVEISGRDEVAEMADALEVFRQHALEVQRLNLVEQLAEELQGKNDELERVLDDLHNAQDQIIMQGKLAALGELTAGVAHEIRNPLNFVNQLLRSFRRVAGRNERDHRRELGHDLDDEQMELIEEISEDCRRKFGSDQVSR